MIAFVAVLLKFGSKSLTGFSMVPQSLADSPHRPQKFDKNSWLFLDARVLNVKPNLGEIFLNLLLKSIHLEKSILHDLLLTQCQLRLA